MKIQPVFAFDLFPDTGDGYSVISGVPSALTTRHDFLADSNVLEDTSRNSSFQASSVIGRNLFVLESIIVS